jgi:hypothetical protein
MQDLHHGSPFFTYSLYPWHHNHQFGGFHLSLSDVAVCMRDVVLTPGLNAPPIPCPHLNWFWGDLVPKKVNPNSYHQLVTIWTRINSGYLKLLTHSSDANWPSQGSVFSSVLIQQPEMDVCCFLGVFQPWARGQGLLILPQLGPTVEKAVLPNSHT